MVNDGEESKRFRHLNLDCMSEESSPDESGSTRVHHPVCGALVVSIHVYPFGACSRITDLWHGSRKPGMIHHDISLYGRTEYFPARTGEEVRHCTAGYQETFGREEKED